MLSLLPVAGTLPLQPAPVGLIVAYIPAASPVATAIVREFKEGEARHCRLCPRELCSYTARGSCLVVAPGVVAHADAALYRLPG